MSLVRSQPQAMVTTEKCMGHPLSGQLSASSFPLQLPGGLWVRFKSTELSPKSGTQKTSKLASDPEASRTEGLKLQLEGLE